MCLFSSEIVLPLGVKKLSKEFEDVFPKDIPHGLPPLRRIEHQIDPIPRASLPNKPAYRSNLKETKEIQRQVEGFVEEGWIRESL